jgi:homoserine O-acetyltransferase
MGGMTTLEYALNTPPGFVRSIIPLATSARHSAWCISWGEAQRQSIYSDPDYRDGYYFEAPADGEVGQPTRGLAAARMAALLTYRSRDSFESRFGRKAGIGGAKKSSVPKGGVRVMGGAETTDPSVASEADLAAGKATSSTGGSISTTSLPSPVESGSRTPREEAWQAHNDGHRGGHLSYGLSRRNTNTASEDGSESSQAAEDRPLTDLSLGVPGSRAKLGTGGERAPKVFSAQSYLRYQGDKVGSTCSSLKC